MKANATSIFFAIAATIGILAHLARYFRRWWVFAILLTLPALAQASTATTHQYFEGANDSTHFWGGSVQVMSIGCHVPNGSPDGVYYFNIGYGANLAVISVSGGVSSRPTALASTLGTAGRYEVDATSFTDESDHTTQVFCNWPGDRSGNGGLGTLLGSYTLKKTNHFNTGSAASTARTGVFQNFTQTGAPPPGPTAHVFVNARGNGKKAHTTEVKFNGASFGNANVGTGPAGVYQYATLDAGKSNAVAGDTWQFLVDGVVVDGGTITAGMVAGDPPLLNITVTTENIDFADTAPTTPPTPTPDQTNQGNSTTTPSNTPPPTGTPPPASPSTVVNNSNTTIGGGSGGATNQDIYNDVLRANIDAGNATSGTPAMDRTPDDISKDDKGESEDVQGKLDGINTGIENSKSAASTKVSVLAGKANDIPTSLGVVNEIDIASLTFGASHTDVKVNLATGGLANVIKMFRAAFLFGLTIGWLVLMVRTIQAYL